MKDRPTPDKKIKVTLIRTTAGEHCFIKTKAAERGITMSRMILEALRVYLKDS